MIGIPVSWRQVPFQILNDDLLEVQTDYAVSIVDDFFSSKVTAVSMFEESDDLQSYFKAVHRAEDIDSYKEKDVVLKELSGALERMAGEMVLQVWIADEKTDSYLLADGNVVDANLADVSGASRCLKGRRPWCLSLPGPGHRRIHSFRGVPCFF